MATTAATATAVAAPTPAVSVEPTRLSILGTESIIIGANLTTHLAKEVLSITPASTYVVVTDKNLVKHGHLDKLIKTLSQEALNAKLDPLPRILSYVLPPGETAKTRETKARVEDWMLGNKCTRDTCVLALGGGVIGDMIGFVASTFMRGVPVIQIPTTLLAMVDSSIGGKTAVDTPAGKNLVGAFHQPKRIFMDLEYLRTLPRREFVNGLAEVIKTAAIWNEGDFELLENHPEEILAFSNGHVGSVGNRGDASLLLKVILGSAQVKAHVVTVDEKESGLRGLLNFGHSVGHAIEAILSPELLHGECVAMGMVKEAEIARHLGHLNDISVGRLVRCLQAYGLPVSLEDKRVSQLLGDRREKLHRLCRVERLLDIMKVDKKNQGNRKRIVLLSTIGKTVEPKASFVDDDVIVKILSPAMGVIASPAQTSSNQNKKTIHLNVPGSKSISNRALVLAALGEGTCRLHGLLHSDDVQVMLDALQKLVGIAYSWENDGETLVVTGGAGRLRVPGSEIYLGNAGTASRFLTTVCALISSSSSSNNTSTKEATILTGNARMKQRPVGPLVDALRSNGCTIEYTEST
ncbi:3-dehydroquinate dehydratase (3-dehydroquinase), partial [Quaeritorhiza haematococci]